MSGLSGNDDIYGLDNNDILYGGMGNDDIFGGQGRDRIVGGQDNDDLTGGTEADTFVFRVATDGNDRIFDFSREDFVEFDVVDPTTGREHLEFRVVGNDVVASFDDGGGTITFFGADPNHMAYSQFLFV